MIPEVVIGFGQGESKEYLIFDRKRFRCQLLHRCKIRIVGSKSLHDGQTQVKAGVPRCEFDRLAISITRVVKSADISQDMAEVVVGSREVGLKVQRPATGGDCRFELALLSQR
jgi:hypothetical protein